MVGITFCHVDFALLAGLHVLEACWRGAVDDGNVAGADPIGLLELALERAAGELELGGSPARRAPVSELERGPPAGTDRPFGSATNRSTGRGATGRSPAASSIRSTPAAHPEAGVGGPSSCSIRPS